MVMQPSGALSDRISPIKVDAPDQILADSRPIETLDGVPSPPLGQTRFYISGRDANRFVDITAYVQAAQWRYGSRFPNRVGGMAEPGAGVLMLSDERGLFSPLNPHPQIDPTPQARVFIIRGALVNNRRLPVRLFSGFSKGVVMSLNRHNGAVVITIPIVSDLGRIVEYGNGILYLAKRNATASIIIRDLLSEAGYAGRADIGDSNLILNANLINTQNIVNDGSRRKTDLKDAIAKIVSVDNGYFFDTPLSVKYFAGNDRYPVSADRTHEIEAESVLSFETQAFDSSVVNVIESRVNAATLIGSGTAPIPIVGDLAPNNVYEIPPYEEFRHQFHVDESVAAGQRIAFLGSIDPLRYGQDYAWRNTRTGSDLAAGTVGIPPAPIAYAGEKVVELAFRNTTGRTYWFVLKQLIGERFEINERLVFANRHSESVAEYGVKSAQWDARLVLSSDKAHRRISDLLAIYNGVQIPMLHCKAVIHASTLEKELLVGDLIYLTVNSRHKPHLNRYPFHVEAVEWSFDSRGTLEANISLIGLWTTDSAQGVPKTGDRATRVNALNWRTAGFSSIRPAVASPTTPDWRTVGYVNAPTTITWETVGYVEPPTDWRTVGYVENAPQWRRVGYVAPPVANWRTVGFVTPA